MFELPRAAPLPLELREKLAALVDRVGEKEAMRLVNLSRGAFSRALAGLRVYPGTLAIVRASLATNVERRP